MSKILKIIVFTFAFACTCLAFSDDKKKDDFWLPMEERVKIWDAVVSEQLSLSLPLLAPKPYTVSSNGLEATFEKDGSKWTIVGANAPIVNPTVYPKDWPVKGNELELLIIPEPITNYKILPFTEKIENSVKSDTISITAAPDSYEPASFVIRSGDADLKNVMVEVTDLKAEIGGKDGKIKTAVIPKENIDVRVVKCWYQAGLSNDDTKHKLLTPELLLHDDDVVRVDYDRQVDLLRNLEKIQDDEKLRTFIIPKNQNKQIWLTAHIKEESNPGKYQGKIRIVVRNKVKKEIKIEIEVLPFILPAPMIDYVLYYYDYPGYHSIQRENKKEWKLKTDQQILYELIDMKEHGLTNATVWHQVKNEYGAWDEDWQRLKRILEIRKQMGWGGRPLLYLDWKTKVKEDLNLYKKKVESIIAIAKSFGINDVYIYGIDERKGAELVSWRKLYQTVHEAGAKNFVACTEDFLIYVPDLLDLPVLYGQPQGYFMKLLNKLGIKVWSYANPQAGIEEPATYRYNYGIKLLQNGFSGACDFTYQEHWNDFLSRDNRSHTMGYSTLDKPIPTIQWEGWREAVNDVRFLTLLERRKILGEEWMQKYCPNSKSCRDSAIKNLIQQ